MATEKIVDKFFSRRLFIQVADVYTGVSEVAFVISQLGSVKEKESLYETDGPVKRASYVAEIIIYYDKNSRLVVRFDAKGDSTLNTLTLDISGEFQAREVETEGIMTKAFHEYYTARVSPFLRKLAEENISSIWNALEYQMKLRFKYSYA